MRKTRSNDGFTLVELMVVVALIGVLAAVAIPSFLTYQARSRRAEAYSNLAALAAAQKSFQAVRNVFHHSTNTFPDPDPYGGLGTHKMQWDSDSEDAFGELGWAPEGQVFYSYMSNACCDLCFTATAFGDVDGNGSVAAVMYVNPQISSDGSIVVGSECPSGLGGDFDFGTPTGRDGPIYRQVATHGTTDNF